MTKFDADRITTTFGRFLKSQNELGFISMAYKGEDGKRHVRTAVAGTAYDIGCLVTELINDLTRKFTPEQNAEFFAAFKSRLKAKEAANHEDN